MQLNHWFSPNTQIKPTLINPIYVPLNHTAEKKLVWIGYSGYAIKWKKKVQLIKAYCRPSCHIYSKQQTWVQSSYTHFFNPCIIHNFFFYFQAYVYTISNSNLQPQNLYALTECQLEKSCILYKRWRKSICSDWFRTQWTIQSHEDSCESSKYFLLAVTYSLY